MTVYVWIESLFLQTSCDSYYLFLAKFLWSVTIAAYQGVDNTGHATEKEANQDKVEIPDSQDDNHQCCQTFSFFDLPAVVGIAEVNNVAVNEPAGYCAGHN